MHSLFQAITGGNDWANLMCLLQRVNCHFCAICFTMYVFVTVFGIMYALTGIFCDAASRVQEVDRELVLADQIAEDEKIVRDLRAVFRLCSSQGGVDLATLRQ